MATTLTHLTTEDLNRGLDNIRQSPKDNGTLELIVRRPETEQREILEECEISLEDGVVGDNWRTRRSDPNPETQITIMNARSAALVAQEKDRWQLAGDQLFVDLDLSLDNLPAGTQLSLGSAVLEVTPEPHTGCKKFVERFGMDAMTWVNSEEGRQLNLRGINTKVVQAGIVRAGDTVKKV